MSSSSERTVWSTWRCTLAPCASAQCPLPCHKRMFHCVSLSLNFKSFLNPFFTCSEDIRTKIIQHNIQHLVISSEVDALWIRKLLNSVPTISVKNSTFYSKKILTLVFSRKSSSTTFNQRPQIPFTSPNRKTITLSPKKTLPY